MVVRFENDSEYRVRLNRQLRPGAGTVVNLPGRRRDIDRVTFNYSDVRGGRKALVTLYGRR